ncbi:hypothetical protein [Asaia siamensis]|nr:hypothetical protein [Asaia siamensis]GBR06450.1 hypothetical protein AA0323_1400 [Asaia siamensis NRIC 0323]
MRRMAVILSVMPCVAMAQTGPAQFVPPRGLPLETPIGPTRNPDGSAVVTLGSMQDRLAQHDTSLSSLEANGVTQGGLQTALAAYLPLAGGTVAGALQIGGDLKIGGKIYAVGYAPVEPNDHSYFVCADGYSGYLYPATQPCR